MIVALRAPLNPKKEELESDSRPLLERVPTMGGYYRAVDSSFWIDPYGVWTSRVLTASRFCGSDIGGQTGGQDSSS